MVANALSALGSGIAGFALSWTSTSLGPGRTAAIATAGQIPFLLLILAAGARMDRRGIRSTLIWTQSLIVLALIGLTVVLGLDLPLFPVLLGYTVLINVIAVFGAPGGVVFIRLFVTGDDLPKAMASNSVLQRTVLLLAPALGASIVAWLGIRAALIVDAVSFVGIIAVLSLIHPPLELTTPPTRKATAVRDGIRAAWRNRPVRRLVFCITLVAGGYLPLVSVCIPLLARTRGWGVGGAGLLSTAQVAGTLTAGLLIARLGTMGNRHRAMVLGVAGVVLSTLVLADAPTVPVAVAASMGLAFTCTVFTSNAMPTFIDATPPEMMARFSSVLAFVQTLANFALTPVIGVIGEEWGISWCIALTAVIAGTALPLLPRVPRPEPAPEEAADSDRM